MLRLLSGKWHEVLTGVALVRAGAPSRVLMDFATTRVRFASMSEDEINWYVSTGEPRGKAGAYGIQGSAALFIEEIQGEYFNVVGLPVRLVYQLAGR
jgi:septum formation protein